MIGSVRGKSITAPTRAMTDNLQAGLRAMSQKWLARAYACSILKFLHPRPHLDLPSPRAAVLLQHVEISLRDCIRIQHRVRRIRCFEMTRATNAAVDHEMRNVDTFGL